MNFKEALIAHLQGERVEYRRQCGWCLFTDRVGGTVLAEEGDVSGYYEFRIKPRTVMCNGVEVPAPERVAPAVGKAYYVPDTRSTDKPHRYTWADDIGDKNWLSDGLVYLDEDACVARAKAMLITQEIK